MISVIVKQHVVQIGRIDGSTECLSISGRAGERAGHASGGAGVPRRDAQLAANSAHVRQSRPDSGLLVE